MIYSDRDALTVNAVLVGFIFTVVIAILVAVSSDEQHKPRPFAYHAMCATGYLPLLAMIVNYLPLPTNRVFGTVLLAVVSSLAVSLHVNIVSSGRSVARQRRTQERVSALEADLTKLQDELDHERSQNRSSGGGPPDLSRPAPEQASHGRILVNSTIRDYRTALLDAETGAQDLAYIQGRIAPFFQSSEAVDHIARARFGEGSPDGDRYRDQYRRRQEAFIRHVTSGKRYREIYPRERLLSYVATGTHARDMWPLPAELVVDLLLSWRNALLKYDTYYVGISDESLPLKYHVIDGQQIVLHEPVGRGDSIRVNSLFIYDPVAASRLLDDFELVWSLIPPVWRSSSDIAAWIETELVPLAKTRASSSVVLDSVQPGPPDVKNRVPND